MQQGGSEAAAQVAQGDESRRMWALAERVGDVLEGAGVELEVHYYRGDVCGQEGQLLVSVGMSTGHGQLFLVEDGFGACWVVFYRDGCSGVARRCKAIDADALALECCAFLDRARDSQAEAWSEAA